MIISKFTRTMLLALATTGAPMGCADTPAQPRLTLSIRGVEDAVSRRLGSFGTPTIELVFAPRETDGGTATRPYRRIALWNQREPMQLIVQVPEGSYLVSGTLQSPFLCGTSDLRSITLGVLAPTPTTLPSTASAPTTLTFTRQEIMGTGCM
ncbi:MAG: hypothetical protein Q8Q09_04535 [Deltaproteobacteria bacterium]|nr:hypothetical protein [Deltaproteobacteria bacterium]